MARRITWEELAASARSHLKPKKTRRAPSHEEHDLQCACVNWFDLTHPNMRLNLFAVPNGGRRDKATGARLKSEGVRAGVSDLILLKQRHGYGALLIEMKTAKGVLSQLQRIWRDHISKDGYRHVVCRSLDDFITAINDYLNEE
jgi:hypothetical protein